MEVHGCPILGISVEEIPQNRDPKSPGVSGMEAKLVGPAGDWREEDEALAVVVMEFSPVADAWLALDWVVDLVGSPVGVESKGQFDSPALALYLPVEEGQVFFVHQAFCKLL